MEWNKPVPRKSHMATAGAPAPRTKEEANSAAPPKEQMVRICAALYF